MNGESEEMRPDVEFHIPQYVQEALASPSAEEMTMATDSSQTVTATPSAILTSLPTTPN